MRLVWLFIVVTAQIAGAGTGVFCALQTDTVAPAARALIGPLDIPVRGAPRVLVVFARFRGEFPEMTGPPSWAAQMFDAERPGSITHFYDTMSRGLLQINGEVAPRFYEASEAAPQYAGEDPLARGDYGRFVEDILAQVDADVDFSRFDSNEDGSVDAVAIALLSAPANFLQGPATGIASLGIIGYYSSNDRSASGSSMRVGNDQGTVQVAPGYGLMVATICHELAHLYGAHDLHNAGATRVDTPPTLDSAGIGAWGLMGWGALGWKGNDGPNPFMAWTRVLFGWADVIELEQTEVELQLEDVTRTGQVARVRLPSGDVFLIENRQRQSFYDRNAPAQGLLIWHVDPRQLVSVDLESADGRWADAGYPIGTRADSRGGGDNLDFWAHDAAFAARHAGNLGDATDVFDGERFTRFGPDTNPDSWGLSRRWNFVLDSLRFVDGTAHAAVTLPEIVRVDEVTMVGAVDGVVVAGTHVDMDFVLTTDQRGVDGPLVVRFESASEFIKPVNSSVLLSPRYMEGAGIGQSSRSCCAYRVSPGEHISFAVADEVPGVVDVPITLVIYEIGATGLQRLWHHAVELVAVGVHQSTDSIEIDDSSGNADGQVQAGELVRFEFEFPDLQRVPRATDGLQLSLSSLDGMARPVETAKLSWTSPAAGRAGSALWLIETAVEADSLAFELEVLRGSSAWRDTLSLALADGVDPSAPIVGPVYTDEGAGSVFLSEAGVFEGGEIAAVHVEIQAGSQQQTEIRTMDRRQHRFQAGLDLPPGNYSVRAVVADAAGNRGFGPVAALIVPSMPGAGPTVNAPASVTAHLSEPVHVVVWTADGDHIAVATGKDVLVLDAAALRRERLLAGHDEAVTHLRAAGDGTLVSADASGTVVVWDPQSAGSPAARLEAGAAVRSLAVSPSNTMLAVATDQEIRLWQQGQWAAPSRRFRDGGATAVAAGDNFVVATGRPDGRVHLWNLATGGWVPETVAGTHDKAVTQLRFMGRDQVVTASVDGTVGMWRSLSGVGVATEVYGDRIVALDVRPDAELVATASADGQVRVTRYRSADNLRDVFRTKVPGVQSVALSPDGLQLAVGNWHGELRKYTLGSAVGAGSVTRPQQVSLLSPYPNPFNGGVWIPYRLNRDAALVMRIFDVTGQLVRTIERPAHRAGDYHASGSALFWDGTDEQRRSVASGVYFVQLHAGSRRDVARIVLLR